MPVCPANWMICLPLALLVACSGGEPEKKTPTPEELAAELAAKAPKKDFAQKLTEARGLALAGDHEGAARAARELVEEKADDGSAWRLLGQELAAGGAARDAYERLGAEPLGGRVGAHHLLRAELALLAGMTAECMEAARAAQAEEPEAAAALVARAVKAGGAAPTVADGTEPDGPTALALYAGAADARSAALFLEKAATVGGWRAALLRAQVRGEQGDLMGALEEYAAAVSGAEPDPRALIAANLGRAQLLAAALSAPGGLKAPKAARGAEVPALPGHAEVGEWAASAGRAALTEGNGALAGQAAELAIPALLKSLRADAAYALASELRSSMDGAKAGAGDSMALVVAQAALAAGRPVEARDAARAARKGLTGAAAEDAAWAEGVASWWLRRAEDIEGAAAGTSGARQTALKGLATVARGDVLGGLGTLPTTGLSDRDAAWLGQEAALLNPAGAAVWLEGAVAASDRSNDLQLRISARLAQEQSARRADSPLAAKVRADLARLAPAGSSALAAELAARSALAGGAATFPEGEGVPSVVGVWSALATQSAPPTGKDAWAEALSPWAAARAGAAAGESGVGDRYVEALGSVPLHRIGALSTGTVLDGSDGLPVDVDIDLFKDKASTDDGLSTSLAAHELGHRRASLLTDVLRGRDLVAGLSETEREGLLAAVSRARVGMAQYHAGGPFPVDAVNALAESERALAGNAVFGRVLPVRGLNLSEARSLASGAALFSFRVGNGRVHGLVVTPTGGDARAVGAEAAIRQTAEGHMKALLAAASTEKKAEHAAGDRLRTALIDVFTKDITGLGRYLVVGPELLTQFPMTTLPEQAAGQRWLADIRTICVSHSLRDLSRPPNGNGLPGSLPYLAIGSPQKPKDPPPAASKAEGKVESKAEGKAGSKAEGKAESKADEAPAGADPDSDAALMEKHGGPQIKLPPEIQAGLQNFNQEGFRKDLLGDQAVLAGWAENAPRARYIHFADVEMAGDGGFKLGDGLLTLAMIRTTTLVAELVVINAEAPVHVQHARVRAFFDAGAKAVMVESWDIPDERAGRLIDGFFGALNRDRPASRALGEAREALLRDSLLGEDLDDPGLWGSMMLFARP